MGCLIRTAIATELLPERHHHTATVAAEEITRMGALATLGHFHQPLHNLTRTCTYTAQIFLYIFYTTQNPFSACPSDTRCTYTFYANCCEDEIQLNAQSSVGGMVSYIIHAKTIADSTRAYPMKMQQRIDLTWELMPIVFSPSALNCYVSCFFMQLFVRALWHGGPWCTCRLCSICEAPWIAWDPLSIYLSFPCSVSGHAESGTSGHSTKRYTDRPIWPCKVDQGSHSSFY
jgi:hypothetical protein